MSDNPNRPDDEQPKTSDPSVEGGTTHPEAPAKYAEEETPSAPSADPAAAAAAVTPGTDRPSEEMSIEPEHAGEIDGEPVAGVGQSSVATHADTAWNREAWFDEDVERHPAVRAIRAAFPDGILAIVRFRNETSIHIRPELLRDIAAHLREHPGVGLNFLSDVTVTDMLRLRESPRFDVIIQLYSLTYRARLRLKAGVDDGEAVPSLVPIWNGANWLEREAYDMFGVIFDGHPNLKRILLADDWSEGHPLRKDYPIRGWSEFPVYNTERTVPRVRTRWTGRGGFT